MNRPLEFRVWDERIGWWESPSLMVYASNIILQGRIFQQFTGLLDKNGKKIFEGDILQFLADDYFGAEILNVPVIYEDGCFFVGKRSDPLYKFVKNFQFEISGNIFENPELLK